jgi:hypothetical protein
MQRDCAKIYTVYTSSDRQRASANCTVARIRAQLPIRQLTQFAVLFVCFFVVVCLRARIGPPRKTTEVDQLRRRGIATPQAFSVFNAVAKLDS